MATKHYAWSDLYYGGKTDVISLPNGGTRTVVVERDIVLRGEEVTAKKIGVADDVWEHLVESGSIRPYPVPEGASDTISPTRAVLDAYNKGGELDQDMLLELAMKQPLPMNPPAEEEAEVEVPKGA